MAKAISTIIATIMLLLITVALIGVFWAFSNSLLSGTTGSAGAAATQTTKTMLQTIAVTNAVCSNTTPTNNIINFTLQNTGTQDITAGGLSVLVDNAAPAAASPNLNAVLAANQMIQAGVQTATYSKTRTLIVNSLANSPITYLNC